MAAVKLEMKNNSESEEGTRSFYRPTEADFKRILERLRARGDRSTLEISPTILDEENETKQEKHERLRQEALQRDQYILSMRPNRHIVFAAKFAKIKNRGLARRFEKQVHIWSQEMERNFRIVGTDEKALEKELQQTGGKEKRNSILPLRKLYTEEKLEKQKGKAKRHSIKLPKLERNKERTHRANRSDNSKEIVFLNGNGNGESDKNKFNNTSVRLPPIENKKNQDSHIE